MAALFDQDGIKLLYPENWELQREDSETGWTLSLQSPGTAFLVISFYADMPEMEVMAQAALDALKGEYEDLEADDCVETVAGQPAMGHDVRFFSLDLTNTCWIRSFYSAQGTVLVMWQINDLELPKLEPVLRAICASITVEED
jgi:hypothetical protein